MHEGGGMSYYVESDGDRVPKDVYIVDGSSSERVLTMECASEDRRFRLALKIVSLLNESIKSQPQEDLGL